jgi:hypothetical protein
MKRKHWFEAVGTIKDSERCHDSQESKTYTHFCSVLETMSHNTVEMVLADLLIQFHRWMAERVTGMMRSLLLSQSTEGGFKMPNFDVQDIRAFISGLKRAYYDTPKELMDDTFVYSLCKAITSFRMEQCLLECMV